MLVPDYPHLISPLSGIYGEVRCTQSGGELTKATLTEFSFPYLLGKEDVKVFLDEIKLRTCLNSMTSTDMLPPSNWSKKS